MGRPREIGVPGEGRPGDGWGASGLSIRLKLFASFVFVAFASLAVGGVLADRAVRQQVREQIVKRLTYQATMLGQMTANALFGAIDPSDTSLNGEVRALAEAVDTPFAVIAPGGAVVADSSAVDPSSVPSAGALPEVLAAAAGETGVAERDGRIYVARAIVRDGRVLGFSRSSASASVVDVRARAVRRRLALGGLVAAVAATILAYAASRRLVRPIRELARGARRVGRGDFACRIEVTSRDEVGQLSVAFNDMTASLSSTVAQLDARNRDMRLVLDHVDQGLFTLDRAGAVAAERSAVLGAWLGSLPAGTPLWEALAPAHPRFAGMLRLGWLALEGGLMPPEVVVDQLPRRLVVEGRELDFEYTLLPGRGGDGAAPDGMLVTVSDVTQRVAAERAEAHQRDLMAAVAHVVKDRAAAFDFVSDAGRLVALACADVRPSAREVRRALHTLKGNAGFFGLRHFVETLHALEGRIDETGGDMTADDRDRLRGQWAAFVAQIDAIFEGGRERAVEVDEAEHEALLQAIHGGVPRDELARKVAALKLERVDDRLQRFAAHARALAQRLGKAPLEAVVAPSGLRLSRESLSPFWGAFVHVVRNAVDHGVETAAERSARGASPTARLELGVGFEADGFAVTVTDDGPGVDWAALAVRAASAGLPHASRAELEAVLLHGGVSTRGRVTETSGRGVGLAAVVDACEQAGGAVSLSSEPGSGTTFRFTFPCMVACGACPGTSSASSHSTPPRLTHSASSRLRVVGDASSPASAQPF